MKKHSWQIFAECWNSELIGLIANRLKLDYNTVGGWKRPIESDEYPSGTGKANIIDHILFVIRLVHKSFPGVAREIADYISDFVTELDRNEGVILANIDKSPCAALGEAVKESSDVVILLASRPNDPQAWKQGRTEIRENISALLKLDGCLENLLETQTASEVQEGYFNARIS